MPQMDEGPADGPPGRELRALSVVLSPAEAQQLVESFASRAGEEWPNPGWHMHITDDDGRELTIGVSGDAVFYNRFASTE